MASQSTKIQWIKLKAKNLEIFFRGDKGQIFTIDALFALIIITIVIGMSANALDIVGFKISDYSAGKSLDRVATDAADIMINTPGDPGWEKSNNTQFVTPGLAQENNGSKNTAKILSYAKINKLKSKYRQLMANVIPLGANSSLTIYPTGSLDSIKMGNETPSENATEIAVVNRTVLVNFKDFRIFTIVDPLSYSEICPHNHSKYKTSHVKPNYNNSTPGWTCKPFKVTQEDKDSTSFYIMPDPPTVQDNNAKWFVDGPYRTYETASQFGTEPEQINSKINGVIGENEEVIVWLHVYTSGVRSKSFNTYLVGVPKGTYRSEVIIENFNPQPAFFVLKIWMD